MIWPFDQFVFLCRSAPSRGPVCLMASFHRSYWNLALNFVEARKLDLGMAPLFGSFRFRHQLKFRDEPVFLAVRRFALSLLKQVALFNESRWVHSQDVHCFDLFIFLHMLRHW
jgi:hypothetical protein